MQNDEQGAALLEKKFLSETGSWKNRMYFEITPGWEDKKLTWSDVGEVLGESGLPKFFHETNEWHCVYFEVLHGTRGKLGYGAVRKWYMLDLQRDGATLRVRDN